MLNIEERGSYRYSIHHLGFRPFFLLAGLFGFASMVVWAWSYHFSGGIPAPRLTPFIWHAHEMIFGYAMAVIAGFLLTAVRNWTNIQTLHGWPLITLALTWLVARLMPFVPSQGALVVMAVLDIGFSLVLWFALLAPVIKSKQWTQLSIIAVLGFVIAGNLVFYYGVDQQNSLIMREGLYLGLYTIVMLILLMGRRVIPFFIEKGLGYPFKPINRTWVDVSSIVLMIIFIPAATFAEASLATRILAALLTVLHATRLYGWYHHGIWEKPLLWILLLAYLWLVVGFLFITLAGFFGLSMMLGIHAFTVGGIGLITLGMMTRVSLGHTGRNVFAPPPRLNLIFILMATASLFRIVFPLLAPGLYPVWMGVSQCLWIISFFVFTWLYAPMLVLPRVDGRYG